MFQLKHELEIIHPDPIMKENQAKQKLSKWELTFRKQQTKTMPGKIKIKSLEGWDSQVNVSETNKNENNEKKREN